MFSIIFKEIISQRDTEEAQRNTEKSKRNYFPRLLPQIKMWSLSE